MKIFCLRKEVYQASQSQVYGQEVQERLDKLKLWIKLKQAGQDNQEIVELLKCSRSMLYRWAARLQQQGLPGLQCAVQVDTVQLSKDSYGLFRTQFSAIDPVTRTGAVQVYL